MSRSLYLLSCCSFLLLGLTLDTQAQTTTLTPGQTHNGTLSSSDIPLDNGQFVQCFDLNVQANQEITVTLRSQQFDAVLMAGTGRCGGGDVDLTMINDDFDSSSTDSQLSFTTTQRDYVIAITSYDAGETGSFTLTVEGPAGSTTGNTGGGGDTPYHVATISTGQHYSGSLNSNSLTLDDGQYVQCVNLDLKANQQVTVTLRSGKFDTQLFVGTGRCLGDFNLTMVNDDFETGSTDSQLQFTTSQSQYLAIISSYGAGETGSYTISMEQGTSTTTAADATDNSEDAATNYLLYGVIPTTLPEGLILGTANGRHQTTEHTFELREPAEFFTASAMCDIVNCAQITMTILSSGGAEIGQSMLDFDEPGAVEIIMAENVPAGTYQIRVHVPDCTTSCRYKVEFTY